MPGSVRKLEAVRRATVRICDRSGTHFGQGLMLSLLGEGTIVLTCHHVVANLTPEELCIAAPLQSNQLGLPLPASYDRHRSKPILDAAVLRVSDGSEQDSPLLHVLDARAYTGALPDRVLCLGYWKADSFDARLGSATQLDLKVDIPGPWPDPPNRYQLPCVFRLGDPSDARPGISGSVVAYECGVLGLTHFSRPAGPDQEREVYLVPLSAWADGWPALQDLIEPLVDARLRTHATVKCAGTLDIGTDISIAGYRSEVYLEPPVTPTARAALANRHGVILVGKPKSGKTRLAWSLLAESPRLIVVIPHDPRPPDLFEGAGLAGRQLVLFFDDLHRMALSADPLAWRRRLEEVSGGRVPIVCKSRDGEEWVNASRQSGTMKLIEALGREAVVFTSRVGNQGADFTEDDGIKLAEALGLR